MGCVAAADQGMQLGPTRQGEAAGEDVSHSSRSILPQGLITCQVISYVVMIRMADSCGVSCSEEWGYAGIGRARLVFTWGSLRFFSGDESAAAVML